MAVYKENIVDIDLAKGSLHRSFLTHTIGSGDVEADHFGVRVFRDGEPVDLTDVSVQGIFNPPQGSPIALTSGNVISGNVAAVVLKQACYNYNGQFCLSIKLVGGGVTGTMRIVDGVVDNTHSTGTVAPTEEVPTYQEVIAQYDAMVAATAAANGAIAKPYAQLTFPVKKGEYAIVEGALKRALVDIATSETYTAAHWTDAKLGPDVSALKSAIDSKLDGIFVDVANDKMVTANKYNVDYQISGNKFTFNGTATAGARIKISNGYDVNNAVQAAWREESIGLINGHTYMLCAEYISGTGYIDFTVYKNEGTGESIRVSSENNIPHNFAYGNPFIADANNARCLCAYYANGRAFSNLVVRFNIIDITMAKKLLLEKIGIEEAGLNNVKDYICNRSASIAEVDVITGSGTYTYEDLTITVRGNRVKLNGSCTTSARIKLTNTIAVSHNFDDSWKSESIPVLKASDKHVIALTCLSGSAGTTSARVSLAGTEGEVKTSVYITNASGYSKGVKYSDPVNNVSDVCCLYIYLAGGASFTNAEMSINLLDMTIMEVLNNTAENKSLNDYYFENDYITGRMNDIITLRAGASIHNASFLWFTDPHYYRPLSSVPENGMQSVQIAKYLKRKLNNRYVICGGDLLRGTLTKSVCRENLIKAREYMDEIYDDLYMCLGNHEYNNPGDTSGQRAQELDSPELYEMLCKHQEMVVDSVSEKSDYSFIDKAQKVQYFIIGCDNASDLFPESVSWLAGQMLNVQSGYHVIIISHIGLTYGNDDPNQINSKFYDVRDIIDAVNSRGTFTYSGTTYNYANVNCEVVCALTGHVHYDGDATTPGGTPIIGTTCDRAFVGSDGDEGVREVRKIGTIGEQAMDYVLIDFDNHTIDMIRLGGSILGASYDSETGKIYDTAVGTGTEYTGAEWVQSSTHKDRHFTYTGHIT